MSERKQLERAIAALEAQRSALGDAVAEAGLVPLREKLAALERAEGGQQSLAGERKQVTVLFADISGFTPLSEKMDPEVLADTMNALWQRIDAAIIDGGGAIDKHIGDAVMALWGVAEAREDDTEQAIRAGLAMQADLATFREAQGLRLTLRVGIHTGPVLLGRGGANGEIAGLRDLTPRQYDAIIRVVHV